MILNKNRNQSHGGLACDVIYLLPHNIGHQWGKVINCRHTSILIPQDGYDWDYFYFMRYSAELKEDTIKIGGAEMFRAELSVIVNNDEYFQRSALIKNKGKKWHVKFNDAEGTTKIMGGNNNETCSLKIVGIDGGRLRSDHKHMKVLFTITSRKPICGYPF
jgi:hypothetical protein